MSDNSGTYKRYITKKIRNPIFSIDHRLSSWIMNKERSQNGFFGLIENPTEIIYVPVDHIKYTCISAKVKSARRHRSYLFRQPLYRDGNILDGIWDQEKDSYERNYIYIGFKQRFTEKRKWEETTLYTRFQEKLESGCLPYRGANEWQEFKSNHLKS